jgi:PIN domain
MFEPDRLPLIRAEPLRAVIDACVFARSRWVEAIVLSAQAGHVVPLWSPCIITETSRLLTRKWIERNGIPRTDAAKRTLSDISHRWFRYVSSAFYVVEDRPPHELLWTAAPPDEDDVPIWTAAVRGAATLVVTANLKDGPPPGEGGLRQHNGITYMHPDDFMVGLDIWGDLMETGQFPILRVLEELLKTAAAKAGTPPVQLSPSLEAFLRQQEERFRTHHDEGSPE